ncbi:hypothetical protein [Mucilaginibacter sp.]|uniref:hypothetical protein n=1 Tax=Mucilaginibacter sp. TaxID=1882438 RepID=UPI00263051FB|nr:hypothetical protein [Mucilaginibacter sp.]MDB5032463.1 hypothetical protein [Mucilaginibacter sp.]
MTKDKKYDIEYSDIDAERRWYDVVDIDARLTVKGMNFLENQKTNNRLKDNAIRQTFILALTAFITSGALIVGILTFTSDRSSVELQSKLKHQTQQLDSLKKEIVKSNVELSQARATIKNLN